MSTSAKLAAFVAALVVLGGGGALAGAAVDPDRAGDGPAEASGHGGGEHGTGAMAPRPVRGLAVAEDGLRLVTEETELRRGHTEQVRFRIVDDAGATVRDFDVEHTKRMHLVVARRDLTGFQHVHPRQAADGSWSVPLRLGMPGSYRMLADFSHEREAHTLATDLRVDGPTALEPLPAAAPTAVSDGGYDVRLDAGGARAGAEARLRFTITKGGEPVRTEPYLGAAGHLVALREGDMAFLHVHPDEGSVEFMATFPTAGRYRLFLQFLHEGRLQTVAFTQEVE